MGSRDDQLRRLIDEQAAEWHVAQSETPLDPKQAREFMRWLRLSPLHVEAYLSIAALQQQLEGAVAVDPVAVADLLAAGEESVACLPGSRERPTPPVRSSGDSADRSHSRIAEWRRGWIALAATVLAAAAVGLAGWWYFGSGEFAKTLATQRGQTLTVRLPDRTTVKLDADSAVAVRFDRRQRLVIVERGQAYFAVVRDAGRPFKVVVGRTLIRDVGTAFNVYRHRNGTAITVADGRVTVWRLATQRLGKTDQVDYRPGQPHSEGHSLAELAAGQQLRIDPEDRVLTVHAVDLWQVLGWLHGRISFDDRPIADVAGEFNRHNLLQVAVVDPGIGQLRISGTFEEHDVRSFVAFLKTLPGVEVAPLHDRRIRVGARGGADARGSAPARRPGPHR